VKGFPFEVALPTGGKIGGVISVGSPVKNLDWRQRRAMKRGKFRPLCCARCENGLQPLLEII